MLATDLPNLYTKKYSNLLQTVRVMIFLYATTVSLIKLMFYIKNKKNGYLFFLALDRRSYTSPLSPRPLGPSAPQILLLQFQGKCWYDLDEVLKLSTTYIIMSRRIFHDLLVQSAFSTQPFVNYGIRIVALINTIHGFTISSPFRKLHSFYQKTQNNFG